MDEVEDLQPDYDQDEDYQDPEELANLRTTHKSAQTRAVKGKPRLHAISERERESSRSFKCGLTDGHFAKDCKSPRRVFC